MADCPLILINIKKRFSRNRGITLIELLIVVMFIGLMAILFLSAFNPLGSLGKARDARRKADLQKLKTKLEDYNNDHKKYPDSLNCGESLLPYLSTIPCDPATGQSYAYYTNGDTYQIYTKLENSSDISIAQVGCDQGCGPGCAYNYGISSPNSGLQSCAECDWYACQGTRCNAYIDKPTCENGKAYCKVSCLGNE